MKRRRDRRAALLCILGGEALVSVGLELLGVWPRVGLGLLVTGVALFLGGLALDGK